MASQPEELLYKYASFLQKNIDSVKLTKGNFATSALVNKEVFLISEKLYQDVAQHFRNQGYTVHAPPSKETFQKACANHARNDMTLLRWVSTPDALATMIVVEIQVNKAQPEMASQHDELVSKYTSALQRQIDKVTLTKGNFATSALVNKEVFLISEKLYQDVAQHFRNQGYTVHAPPSKETFQKASANYARNDMSATRYASTPDALNNMILVEMIAECDQKGV
jgi:hypothetical protein